MTVKRFDRQAGATLIVSLIMLVMITLIVVSAYNMSTTNLKAVSNVQCKREGIAAADVALKERISSTFTAAPAASTMEIDLDQNGSNDYVVTVTPTCIRAIPSAPPPSSLSLTISSSASWMTTWDIAAQISTAGTTNDACSTTSVLARAGVRVLLSDTQKTLACP